MTAIEGACDMVINGMDYFYQAEQESEYLVLFFSSDVELTNWQNLIRNTDESRDISKLRKQKRILTVSKNSTLTFAIKR
jgi:type IV secretory pathway component VirB8